MNTNNGAINPILSSSSKELLSLQQPQFSSSEDRFIYFIGVPQKYNVLQDDHGTKAKQRNLYRYDTIEDKIQKIWSKDKGIINNFSVASMRDS